MAVVFTFALGLAPQPARAGTYDVAVCGTGDGSAGTADGMTSYNDGGSYGYMDTLVFCTSGGPSIIQHAYIPNSSYSSWTWNGNGWWKLAAPASTSLASLTMRQRFAGFQSYFTFDLTTPDGRLLERAGTWGGAMIPSATRTFVVNAPSVTGRFYCALSSCSGTGTIAQTDQIVAGVGDDHAPTFDTQPTGSLLTGSPVRGIRGASYDASDLGGGVYSASLVIDGTAVKTVTVGGNGGRCAKPFTFLVPCQLHVSGSVSIDTTTLTEGEHQAQVAVTDATETNTTLSVPTTIAVDNVPLPSGGTPSIAGSATAGTTLTAKAGTWDGATGSFAFQWQRCDASGSGCENVATGATYALTLADVGSRMRVRVTATNSAGETVSALSALSAAVGEQSIGAQGASGDAGHAPAAPSSSAPVSNGTAVASLNGRNGSARARLAAAFQGGRRALATTAGKRVRIVGRLVNAENGMPIDGARIEQVVRLANGRVETGHAINTSTRGTFALTLARGAVSGTRTFRYRAGSSADAAVVATATVRLRVRAGIEWRARSTGRVLTFSGRISRPVPKSPAQYVEVQWRRGAAWATLDHPVRVLANGRWSLRYSVGPNVRSGQRFQFRAAIRATSARYPYEATRTRARWVTVR